MPNRNQPKGKPITNHPLFPAVVALWFGALFGLGSFAVRPALLEALVLRSRIDLIFPAATPPLGMTARILLALSLAALGTMIGMKMARQIGAFHQAPVATQRKRSARSQSPALHPLDKLSARVPAAPPPPPQDSIEPSRRRSLALEHAQASFSPNEAAPLPGGLPHILNIAGMDLGQPMQAPIAALDLADFEALVEPAYLDTTPTAPIAARQIFGMLPGEEIPTAPPQIFGQSPLGTPSHAVDHIEDEAPSARTDCTRTDCAPVDRTEQATAWAGFEQPAIQPLFHNRAAPSACPDNVMPWLSNPDATDRLLAELPIIDLARRLGDALQQRQRARPPAPMATEPVSPLARPQHDIQAPVAQKPLARLPNLPAALRPVGLDQEPEEDAADDALLVSLMPPRRVALDSKTPQIEAPLETETDNTNHGADYGSLLGLGRATFVRVEEPEDAPAAIEPIVIFPGQMALRPLAFPEPHPTDPPLARFNSGETERALRSALANLQRISGAA